MRRRSSVHLSDRPSLCEASVHVVVCMFVCVYVFLCVCLSVRMWMFKLPYVCADEKMLNVPFPS